LSDDRYVEILRSYSHDSCDEIAKFEVELSAALSFELDKLD